MSQTGQRYRGFKSFKMDPKFRVAIPASWRPEIGATLFLLLSNEHDMPVIKVLSQEAYDAKIELVNQSNKTPAEKGAILGKLAMLCREASLNDQGKLLVPKDLSEQAGLAAESDVVLAGRELHFEIWSKPNFDVKLAIELAKKEDDDLGIF